MEEKKRDTWGSRGTFILAAVGSAVGLGNAWRFPGLASKYGGGTFLAVYLLLMLLNGIPLLMMEIAIGRKTRSGIPNALRSMNKKFEPIGWAATANAFVISSYYAVVFGWVILMAILCFKFAGLTGDTAGASSLWAETIKTTGTTTGFTELAWPVIGCMIIAWGLIYACIRNGASSVGKVVKYTVFLPIICLIILAVRGLTMPGGIDGLQKLFVPDFSMLGTPDIWIDACGQVFYSLSIMMAIIVAYGSYLDSKSNIAVDAMIIAFSDMAVSVLSGIVMFTTMGGVGMLDNMSDSGVATAFIIYPQAIVMLTNNGVANAIFAFVFYFCLCTLAIDSAFSIIEGVSAAVADKFGLKHKKTTRVICIVAAIISIVYCTRAGLAALDIVDHFTNFFNLILIGILETVAVGFCFKTSKVLKEINKNTKKFKMPTWWFELSLKFIAPVTLCIFFVWNMISLFKDYGGVYGVADGYSVTANIILGWVISILVILSGLIVMLIEKAQKKKGKNFDVTPWDEIKEED